MITPSLSNDTRRVQSTGALRWVGVALLVGGIVILLDVLSKWIVERELGPGATRSSFRIMGDFVELHYALNSGIAFGLLSGTSTVAGVLVGVVFVPLVAVLVVLSSRGLWWALASGLVLGGAFGNLIDRIGDETVTDFVSIGRWPLFNVADSAITVGALILLGLSLFEQRGERESDSNPTP